MITSPCSHSKTKSISFLPISPSSRRENTIENIGQTDTALIDKYINDIQYINKFKYKICCIVYTCIVITSGYLFYKFI